MYMYNYREIRSLQKKSKMNGTGSAPITTDLPPNNDSLLVTILSSVLAPCVLVLLLVCLPLICLLVWRWRGRQHIPPPDDNVVRSDSFVQRNIHSTTSLQDNGNGSELPEGENFSDIWPSSSTNSSLRSRSSYTGQFSDEVPPPHSQESGDLPGTIIGNPNADNDVIVMQPTSEMVSHIPLPVQVSGEASPNPRGWKSFKKRARSGFARRWSRGSQGSRRSHSLNQHQHQNQTRTKETFV